MIRSYYVIHLRDDCIPLARVLKILTNVYQYEALSRINVRYVRNVVNYSHNIEIENEMSELIVGFKSRFINLYSTL